MQFTYQQGSFLLQAVTHDLGRDHTRERGSGGGGFAGQAPPIKWRRRLQAAHYIWLPSIEISIVALSCFIIVDYSLEILESPFLIFLISIYTEDELFLRPLD